MPAHARVGQTFQQENYPGHAEDKFRILSLTAHVTTALVSSRHGMLTREWTRLEPGVVDHKFYIRDIGNVGERTIRGGHDFQQAWSGWRISRGPSDDHSCLSRLKR